MSAPAAILCVKCGSASPAAVPSCAKCGGKNARVCGGCGFQNSLAKNYCDKCGNPISELTSTIAPPPPTAVPGASPSSDIPVTVVKHLKKDAGAPPPPAVPSPGGGAPPAAVPPAGGLPVARRSASVPGAAPGAPLPFAGAQDASFGASPVSGDPWAAMAPAAPVEAPKHSRFWSLARMAINVAAGTLAAAGSVLGIWYWNVNRKPETVVPRVATRYLEALRARDYDAAYAMFSAASKKYCTPDEFKASRDSSTWTWSDLRIEHQEPGAILLAYELKVEGAEPRTDRVLFVEEDKKWVRPYSWVLMRKVEEAFDKGNADMGLVLAQAAAVVNPRDPMARGYLCEAAYYRKAPEETEKQCVTALDLSRVYPSNLTLKSLYHLHAILADTYKNALKPPQPEKALDQFGEMLAFPNISPADQCEILLARSEAYASLSRPGEALADLDRSGQLCVKPADQQYIEELRRRLGAPQN